MSDPRSPANRGGRAPSTSDGRSGANPGRAAGSTGSDAPTGDSPRLHPGLGGGSPSTQPCPQCSASCAPGDVFCEACGHAVSADAHNAGLAGPARPWTAEVAPDRAYFDRVAPAGVSFPSHTAVRRFVCDKPQTRIGRHTGSLGPRPEIDLAEPPVDPAISRLHATLLRAPDGRYSVLDSGSANGLTINDNPGPVPVGVPLPLAHGDRIHLGAWTTITLSDP